MFGRLRSYFRDGSPVRSIERLRAACVGASDLVDIVPSGPARAAAWSAYALETYGDALLGACARDGYVGLETAHVLRASFVLAGTCVHVASGGAGDLPSALPRWRTVPRTHAQLVGMRRALEALHTYLAYELGTDDAGVVAIAEQLEKVDRLWIEHAPPAIRGGLGDALTKGLDLAYDLGRRRLGA